MASEVPDASWLEQEARSESTLPFLNFLLSAKPHQTAEKIASILHEVTARVGKQEPPLSDESEQSKDVLLTLMKNGPGKVTGNPTVSLKTPWPGPIRLNMFRSPLSEPAFLVSAPDTN